MPAANSREEAWPPLEGGGETQRTLFLWGQIVGKTRLALAPMQNHWWQVPFYLSARGLTTSTIPSGDRAFDVELDFVGHQLVIRTSDGAEERLPLADVDLPTFYERYLVALNRLGIDVRILPRAVEIPDAIRFDRDHLACRYDAG